MNLKFVFCVLFPFGAVLGVGTSVAGCGCTTKECLDKIHQRCEATHMIPVINGYALTCDGMYLIHENELAINGTILYAFAGSGISNWGSINTEITYDEDGSLRQYTIITDPIPNTKTIVWTEGEYIRFRAQSDSNPSLMYDFKIYTGEEDALNNCFRQKNEWHTDVFSAFLFERMCSIDS